jgi:hypothetical protein
LELANPIADILARTRRVVATAEPFNPANSNRRFTVGAPDGVSAVILPPLLADLCRLAPRIDIFRISDCAGLAQRDFGQNNSVRDKRDAKRLMFDTIAFLAARELDSDACGMPGWALRRSFDRRVWPRGDSSPAERDGLA